jgi:hemerythrin-like metal-binding protein
MEWLTWDPEWETGNAGIDTQHKDLLSLIQKAALSARQGQTEKASETVLPFLLDYLDIHIQAEEEFMKAVQYPGFEEHQLAHRVLRARVHGLVRTQEEGDPLFAIGLPDNLLEWFQDHFVS